MYQDRGKACPLQYVPEICAARVAPRRGIVLSFRRALHRCRALGRICVPARMQAATMGAMMFLSHQPLVTDQSFMAKRPVSGALCAHLPLSLQE